MHFELKFVVCGLGIFVCYFYYGLLQEQVTRGKYSAEVTSENGEKTVISERYTYALTLVFIQCFVNYLFARGVLFVRPTEEDKTAKVYYASVALTYLLAMVCSNMALQWVAYPTQVVGKAAKPIPVLILGVLLGRKSYPFRKYLFTFMIVLGVILFMYKNKNSGSALDGGFGLGEILILLSLTMDGLIGAIQERMRAGSNPKPEQMMRGMNAWSCIYLIPAMIWSGEITKFIQFVSTHPEVLKHITLLAIAGGTGQLFIFSTVSIFLVVRLLFH
ncbi:solute carrier family 35 member B1 homolog [Agrilus planipennis]|uniref:Solute carrier family 35 member B1 homolog n=1 Tax=Agrilus planipennis TaxID=224129 RepID=A0A1W4WG01_AGRPL|nr:solute carrier family 35 member B1 homolog [Agrilus planipennis]